LDFSSGDPIGVMSGGGFEEDETSLLFGVKTKKLLLILCR
jgi:hypothetical protein